MKSVFIFFCLILTSQIFGQLPTGLEVVEKSIQYHDPMGNWDQFNGNLYFHQLHPGKTVQNSRTVTINRPENYFRFEEKGKNETVIREVEGEKINTTVIATRPHTEEDSKRLRLDDDRAVMYRDYYMYLYGLPMKLKDKGAIINPVAKEGAFNGHLCYIVRVNYLPEAGDDVWDFYFDNETFALVGYRFFHDESKNDGEYIFLYGEETIQGIKIPKNRFWYTNKEDRFLGADYLLPEKAIDKKDISMDDYKGAIGYLWNQLNNKKVYNLHVNTQWFEDESALWYEFYDGNELAYYMTSLNDYSSSLLFDKNKLVNAWNIMHGDTLKPDQLELGNIKVFNKDSISFRSGSTIYDLQLKDYALTKKERPASRGNGRRSVSPDGRYTAYTEQFNLFLKDSEADTVYQLSFDGSEHYAYASYLGWFDLMEGENGSRPEQFRVSWSPDSKYLMANICDTRFADKMYMLDYSVDSLFRPRLYSYFRGSPGDTTMVHYIPVFFDLESKTKLNVPLPRNTHINSVGVQWDKKGGKVFANIPERGYKNERLVHIDLQTGEEQLLIEESSNTNVDDFRFWILDTEDKILFASQRSGWRQLYMFDINSQTTKKVTDGDYFVHDVVNIDTSGQKLFFLASGREQDFNPYHQQLYSIGFDGDDIQLLTPENLHHEVVISKDRKFFVDNFSSATITTKTVLRSAEDGSILTVIAKADVEALYHEGWVAPLTFETTGRDGVSPIYGALWLPTHFNPHHKYPIIDHSYTGPHTQMFPKDFRTTLARNNQALAELGFVVIQVDGMGTFGRSKAFHDVSYKNMGKNLEDHVIAIRALGKRYDWIDTTRVGIFGHSAGGYDAGHAVLEYPDFYKVAVASSADHDFRMEKAWWPEMYMGWPVDSTYHKVSNITMAGNLKGKLLLVHGSMDDNVNASATFKLAEALVKADKEFDLLIFPSQRHGYSGQHQRYFTKKRWNYFVEHLLGETPIWNFSLEE